MSDKILNLILSKEDISWRTILVDLVKSEQMDVWDVDIRLVTKRYLQVIKKMKELDLKISGKILLASALLLKIKSDHLLTDDLNNLDNLFASSYEEENDEFFELNEDLLSGAIVKAREKGISAAIKPKTPQPRKRKISLSDLTDALQKVVESRKKRLTMLSRDVKRTYIPKSAREISNIIKELMIRVKIFFEKNPKQKLFFNHLISNKSKEETVAMFVPLLHLDKEQKVDLRQKEAFGDIEIRMQK